MTKSPAQLKVYLSVVHKLKEMIQRDGLTAGDRLPSERELSERLSVGRSSVREAFRALELLGLIETRHGEGTFLRDFRDHHLVELLGMFILQNGQAEKDVLEMKIWVEMGSMNRLLQNDASTINWLFDSILTSYQNGEITTINHFKSSLFGSSGNRLAFKVWLVLYDFDRMSSKESAALDEDLIYTVKKAALSKDMTTIRTFCAEPVSLQKAK
ncbi:hypothetical protein KR50_29860 [Jeotgalibacillus campisalis]|uniref:HTH gntR-type domain-containing protein n=2 Tax=Jeotgalibacillus campisalis TaxID=220754 RepID=A0A0C2VPD1_9BACL|nr:GntR family transcriptional regulator [Jeotgalibacillus campisalis]KIL46311.1 hypothetical protein KR50_29860 [Jeotgalibacillus campisalis]